MPVLPERCNYSIFSLIQLSLHLIDKMGNGTSIGGKSLDQFPDESFTVLPDACFCMNTQISRVIDDHHLSDHLDAGYVILFDFLESVIR